jgi:hypothetical protein
MTPATKKAIEKVVADLAGHRQQIARLGHSGTENPALRAQPGKGLGPVRLSIASDVDGHGHSAADPFNDGAQVWACADTSCSSGCHDANSLWLQLKVPE